MPRGVNVIPEGFRIASAYVDVKAELDQLSLAKVASAIATMRVPKIPLSFDLSAASVAKANADIRAGLAGAGKTVDVPVKATVDKSSIATATVATKALTTAVNDNAAATQRIYGFWGLFNNRFATTGLLFRNQIPLWHQLVAGVFEFGAVAIPAMIAFGAAAAAAKPAIQDIATHVKSVSTVTRATGQDIVALDAAFDKVAKSVAPGALEIYGAALNATGHLMQTFGFLARGAMSVWDQWAAKIDIWVASGAGGFLAQLRQHAIPDMTLFGQLLGNLAMGFSNLLRAMPGVAEVILRIAVGLSRLFEIATSITGNPLGRWAVEVALALEGINRWGGVAARALTGLLSPAAKLAQVFGDTSVVGKWGMSVRGAMMAAGEGRAGIDGLRAAVLGLGSPAVLIAGGAIAGLLIGLIALMARGKTGAAELGAQMQSALSSVNFQTGLDMAIRNINTLTVKQDQANASMTHYNNVATETVAKNQLFASSMHQNALSQQQNADAYHAAAQQQQGDVAKAGLLIGRLSQQFGVSYPQALVIANMANVNLSQSFKEMWQMVQNLVAGYGGMHAVMGMLGADTQAVTFATELQNSKVQQLNQSFDTFIQTVQAPSNTFLAFAQSITQFGADAQVAGAQLSGLGTNAVALNRTFPRVSTAAIRLRQDFNATVAAAEPMLNSLRTAALVTRDGGPVVKGIQATVAALIPLAGKSTEARDQIYALAQEAGYHGPDSLKALAKWVGNVNDPLKTLDTLTGNAAKALSNLGTDAQQLAQVIQSTLNQTLVEQANQLTGVSAKTLIYLQDLKNYGPTSAVTQAALQNVNDAQNQSNSLVVQGASGITTLTQNVEKYGGKLTATQAARKKLQDDIAQILNTVPTASGDISKFTTAVQNQGTKSDAYKSSRAKLIADLEKAGIDAQTAAKLVDGLGTAVKNLPAGKTIAINVRASGNWTIGQGAQGSLPGRFPQAAAKGMRIPGFGGGDIVPLLVEPGETVVSKEHTSLLAHIFKAIGVPGFQGGGIVPSYRNGPGGAATWATNDYNATVRALEVATAKATAAQLNSMLTAGGGGIPGAGVAGSGTAMQIARNLLAAMGWAAMWPQFNALVMAESGWNVHAMNPSSGAYGIPQALPASKMASAGSDWYNNPATQLRWMMGYIAGRYGNPANAWAHEMAFHWYGKGTPGAEPGWAMVGEKGPELAYFYGGEPVLDAATSKMVMMAQHGYAGGTNPVAGEFCPVGEHGKTRNGLVCRRSSDGRWRWEHPSQPGGHSATPVAGGFCPVSEHGKTRNGLKCEKHSDGHWRWTHVGGIHGGGTPGAASVTSGAAGLARAFAGATIGMNFAADLAALVKLINERFHGTHAKWRDAMVTRQVKAMEHTAAQISAVNAKIAAVSAYQQSTLSNLQGYAGLSGLNLGSAYVDTGHGTQFLTGPQYLKFQLNQKLDNLRKFGSALTKLQKAKVSPDLIRQIVDMGPDQGLAYANEILSGGSAYIKALNATEAAITAQETLVSQQAANAVYGLTGTGKAFLAGLKSQQAALDAIFKREGQVLAQEIVNWFHLSGIPVPGAPKKPVHHVPNPRLDKIHPIRKKRDAGGWLMPDEEYINTTSEPEMAIPRSQFAHLGEAIADALVKRGVAGHIEQKFYGPQHPTPEMQAKMRLELAYAIGVAP